LSSKKQRDELLCNIFFYRSLKQWRWFGKRARELCYYYMLRLCQPPVYSFFHLSFRINVTLRTQVKLGGRLEGTQLVIHPSKIRGGRFYIRAFIETPDRRSWWLSNENFEKENTTARSLDARWPMAWRNPPQKYRLFDWSLEKWITSNLNWSKVEIRTVFFLKKQYFVRRNDFFCTEKLFSLKPESGIEK